MGLGTGRVIGEEVGMCRVIEEGGGYMYGDRGRGGHV